MDIDRRGVLAGAAAMASSTLTNPGGASMPAQGATMLDEPDYGDVTLLDGRARQQADQTLDAVINMSDDALLRPFRAAVGLPTPGPALGGWYDPDPSFNPPGNLTGYIPGHSFGQYLSALARGHAVTGDQRARQKVERLVAAYAPTISPKFYANYPIPAYTYDKLMIGLIDAFRFTGNRQALQLIDPTTQAVLPYLPGKALDRAETQVNARPNVAFGWDETYTLAENLYLAAKAGAGDRFRTMAPAYLLRESYLDPLAAGRNVLAGRHAYSHVNALASAMRGYLHEHDPALLAAARNGMAFVIAQSFATGGWGPDESFIEAGSGGLGASLSSTHRTFEAPCGTYGHFKVARALMRVTQDSRYGDGMEKLFYNAALGLLPLRSDGIGQYYADYNDIGAKSYYESSCPCCAGSIGQLTADYGISAYLRDDKGLFVNLYTPSRAVWRRHGEPLLTLTQQGNYPLEPSMALHIEAPRPVAMALRLRIPAWAGPGTQVAVNGRDVTEATAGRFLTITRTWQSGDKVDLRFDLPLRLEAVDAHHADRVALVQGPLALFATGDRFALHHQRDLLQLRQAAPGATEWLLNDATGKAVFKPYFALGGEPSRLYQRSILDAA
ncbi:beta-L-arabinofuranosidase domain-containing protein [Novosphingobium terrae]|uniref:beta-L-arabinofuranosidase domain-containing protein n=1 Tax=Novosphingobium terrae TaxID=2726189 RepID=UPI00197F355F|nr:beta-L-arabinofuranosidase domain-containing protein [Novosphingobium terrae]